MIMVSDLMLKKPGKRVVVKAAWDSCSMRERADLIGAKLKIESEPGQGTTVWTDLKL